MTSTHGAHPRDAGIPDVPGVNELLGRLQAWSQSGKKPEAIGRDGFPMYSGDPLAAVHRQLDAFLSEIPSPGQFWMAPDPNDLPAGRILLNLDPKGKAQAVRGILVRIRYATRNERSPKTALDREISSVLLKISAWGSALRGKRSEFVSWFEFHPLASSLLRSNLPLSIEDLSHLVAIVGVRGEDARWCFTSPEIALRAVERFAETSEPPPQLREELERWKRAIGDESKLTHPERKILTRIKTLLDQYHGPEIVPGEAWSNAAIEDLKKVPPEKRVEWNQLLEHCQNAESSKPSQKWSKTATQLMEAVGREEFKGTVRRWFELVALPRPVSQEARDRYSPDPDLLLDDQNSMLLKGLVWACAGWADPDVARAVSRLAQVCFKKVPNLGARCPRIGNACLYALSVTKTDEAAAELSRLNQMVKQPSATRLIEKSLDKAAELSGRTREDLEEATVPTYGLDREGRFKQPLGDFTAEFSISGDDAFQLLWRKADGKLQRSAPADVKESHAPELKALKNLLKDIEKMFPAQRQRIERLMATEREWEFDKWRARYLDHPLLASVTRKLIWHFRQNDNHAAGIWHEGKVVDVHDHPLDWLSPKTRVRLWHPLGQDLTTVAGWRGWLEAHQVTQPFKQAHREIYVLTDAERQTATYSNRFAGHIIRQHQFAALARERGWNYRLQGGFDSHNTPVLLLPQWNLTVEYWVEPPGGNEGLSDSGIYLHLSTDQVRFCDGALGPRALEEVPALAFSEVMRDVDLFVGVCSIGNDPAWHDQGGVANRHVDYWRNFAFGDLSATAKTRREVLEKLVPRLKIASQCSLEDKFLVVRGKLRTYKIHLGSSNIVMEPNNEYLCIVADRGNARSASAGAIFLPFEGDGTLAVILSKAFLLAEDSKIKDPTITRQINR